MNNLERWKMEIRKMNAQNVASRMKCDFCPVADGCRVFKSGNSYKKNCIKRIAKWAAGETKPTISFDEWKSGITYSKSYNFKRALEYAAGECPEKPKKSSPTLGISRVISSGPSLVSRASVSYSSI